MRKAGWITLSATSLAGGAALWWMIRNSRFAAGRAEYDLVVKDGHFELREYGTLQLAGTPLSDEKDSFMRLFGYISGENRTRRKISMTAPVLITEEDGQRTMNFVLPSEVVREGAPTATSLYVDEATLPAGCFAAYRFPGVCDLLVESAKTSVLRDWVRHQGFEPVGEALVALYDPPWMPGPLRRNEILLRVA
jgi:SOUL heme-binding protein